MAVRFNKRVSIGKGASVSFSKRGARVSIGGRGHNVSFGPGGTYANFGIPGTGISTRKKISGGSKKKSKSRRSTTKKKTVQNFTVHLYDDGKISVNNVWGVPITDPAKLRQIQATSEYKSEVRRLKQAYKEQQKLEKEQYIEQQRQLAEEYNAERETFVNIHELAPVVPTIEEYREGVAALRPEVAICASFEEPVPTESDFIAAAQEEAKAAIPGLFKGKQREEYVNNKVAADLNAAIIAWNARAQQFKVEEEARAAALQTQYNQEYLESMEAYNAMLVGDEDTIEATIANWIGTLELPVDNSVGFEVDEGVIWIDLDLPEIEDIPETEYKVLASGELRIKNRTKTAIQTDYAQCVLGLSIFMAAGLFAISPTTREVILSGYTQRRNQKTGDIVDDYIISVRYTRDKFEDVDLSEADPEQFFNEFQNRCLLTKTKIFKSIQPYEMGEV